MTVAAILKHKGYKVVTVEPGATIAEVAEVLSERRLGAVLVVDEAERLLGIVSERDIVQCLGQHGARTLEMAAADLMTRSIQTATPSMSVGQAMEAMTAGRFRHLPVVEHGVLVGLVSIGDVVKARIMQQAHEVDSLKAYVAGDLQ